MLAGAVDTGDRNEFGVHALGKDACPCEPACARYGFAAQGGIHMDVAVGQNLGTGVDHGQHNQIAALGIELLTRAQGLVEHQSLVQIGRRRQWRGRNNRLRCTRGLSTDPRIIGLQQAALGSRTQPSGLACFDSNGSQTVFFQQADQCGKVRLGLILGKIVQIDEHWILVEKARRFTQLFGQGRIHLVKGCRFQLESHQRQICAFDVINRSGGRKTGHGQDDAKVQILTVECAEGSGVLVLLFPFLFTQISRSR